MTRHIVGTLMLVCGLLLGGRASGERLGGDPRGLAPAAARLQLRTMLRSAVGGKQHVLRTRAWEGRGAPLRVKAVWNNTVRREAGTLAVERAGVVGKVVGKDGRHFSARHYVSYDPKQRRASYIIEHVGSRTDRRLLRQSSDLIADRQQIARSLGVRPETLGPSLASYAIEETRLTHAVPIGPGGIKPENLLREKQRFFLTSPNGARIMPLSSSQVVQLNQLHHDNTRP